MLQSIKISEISAMQKLIAQQPELRQARGLPLAIALVMEGVYLMAQLAVRPSDMRALFERGVHHYTERARLIKRPTPAELEAALDAEAKDDIARLLGPFQEKGDDGR